MTSGSTNTALGLSVIRGLANAFSPFRPHLIRSDPISSNLTLTDPTLYLIKPFTRPAPLHPASRPPAQPCSSSVCKQVMLRMAKAIKLLRLLRLARLVWLIDVHCCLLLATDCLLLAVCCLLLAACCLLPGYLLPTACCLLLAVCYLLLALTCYLLLAACYVLLAACYPCRCG